LPALFLPPERIGEQSESSENRSHSAH
jgi:hypothetical protein